METEAFNRSDRRLSILRRDEKYLLDRSQAWSMPVGN